MCIRDSDRTVSIRVVDDGREEVDRSHQRLVVAQAVDSRVVRFTQADQQVGIIRVLKQAGERAQHVRQGLRRQLGRSASAGRQAGQADFCSGRVSHERLRALPTDIHVVV